MLHYSIEEKMRYFNSIKYSCFIVPNFIAKKSQNVRGAIRSLDSQYNHVEVEVFYDSDADRYAIITPHEHHTTVYEAMKRSGIKHIHVL